MTEHVLGLIDSYTQQVPCHGCGTVWLSMYWAFLIGMHSKYRVLVVRQYDTIVASKPG